MSADLADRQVARYRQARLVLHEATAAHRRAVEDLERASSEFVVASSALAERLALAGASPPAVMPLPFGGKGGVV